MSERLKLEAKSQQIKGKRKRHLCFKILVPLLSLFLSLVALEVYLRIDDRRPQIAPIEIRINQKRYNLYEEKRKFADPNRPPWNNSIVFIGDSFTVGGACGLEQNYPGVFQRLLRDIGLSFDTVNLGKSDTNTFDYLSVTQDVLSRHRPLLGIITLFHNDIEYSCSLCGHLSQLEASDRFSQAELAHLKQVCEACKRERNAASANFSFARKLHRALFRFSYLYRLSRDASIGVADTIGLKIGWGASYNAQWLDKSALPYKLVKFSLERVVFEFRRARVPVTIVMYPPVTGVSRDNPMVDVYERIVNGLSRELGTRVHSGYAAFLESADSRKNMTWSLTDKHPNCLAHSLFANWVLQKVRAQFPNSLSNLENAVEIR